jgi:hypothetical protein
VIADIVAQPSSAMAVSNRSKQRGKPLVSYRINRQVSGWIPPPQMIRAFGAHCQQPTYAAQQRAA